MPEAIHYFADQGGSLSNALIDNGLYDSTYANHVLAQHTPGFLLVQIQWAQLVGNVWDVYSSVNSTAEDLLLLEKGFRDLEYGLSPPWIPNAAGATHRRPAHFQVWKILFLPSRPPSQSPAGSDIISTDVSHSCPYFAQAGTGIGYY